MQRKSKAEIKKMLEEMRRPANETPGDGSGSGGQTAGHDSAKKETKTPNRAGTYRPKI